MALKILFVALICLGILVGMCTLYLLSVALMPGFPSPQKPLQRGMRRKGEGDSEATSSRRELTFEVNGIPVSAWLYLPDDVQGPVPCIIMGHGAGGTREMMLHGYAAGFQRSGFAVLAFDYRYFGDSGGQPRNLLWIPHQLEDWSAAVAYVRNLKEIDAKRIALWGTSMGGGHAIVTASKDPAIACVAAQCPGLDGKASGEAVEKREGIKYILRMVVHGQRDIVRSWLGLSPHKIPVVGEPGEIALMTTENAYDLFSQMAPEDFVNEACARIVLRSGRYRPVKYARMVRCPVLLQICDRDTMTPPSAVRETEKNLGVHGEIRHYPLGHFEIYTGENFEKALKDQLEFFKKHL
jgi:cephalosporin-C deacetylase-like acetyl esterase